MEGAGSALTEPEREPGARLRLSWAHPSGLLSLSVVNFLLRILTLGLYNFWGKTEVRKRIWSAVRLEGEPLHYTGTGKELFLGFLIVFFLVIVPVILLSFAAALMLGPDSVALAVLQMVLYAVFFFLTGIAIYRAQRYRLSRTRWRGIRGALAGDGRSYAGLYFWTALLIPLTLGWIVPWRSTRLQEVITNDMRFGDRPFRFTAASGPLYGRFALLWVGAVIIITLTSFAIAGVIAAEVRTFQSLGGGEIKPSGWVVAQIVAILTLSSILYAIASAWYRARQLNHFAAHTHFEEASFKGRVTGGGLMWIGVTNILIVLFSLGLLSPVAQARAMHYLVQNLEIDGTVRLGAIAQSADQEIKRGEGLAQAFDVDAF